MRRLVTLLVLFTPLAGQGQEIKEKAKSGELVSGIQKPCDSPVEKKPATAVQAPAGSLALPAAAAVDLTDLGKVPSENPEADRKKSLGAVPAAMGNCR